MGLLGVALLVTAAHMGPGPRMNRDLVEPCDLASSTPVLVHSIHRSIDVIAVRYVAPIHAATGRGALPISQPIEPLVRAVHSIAYEPHVSLKRTVADTSEQRLFEYSDGYATRLEIHRKASYAMLPLFALQIVTGEVLLRDRESPPGWAKAVHRPFAYALGGLFAVNLVTGGLNALEVRRDPNAGLRPTLHTALMLLADAGFVWSGIKASGAGKPGPTGRIRTTHRKIALVSIGMATTGLLMMIPPFRN